MARQNRRRRTGAGKGPGGRGTGGKNQRTPEEQQAVDDHFAAVQRTAKAEEESGDKAVKKMQTSLDFLLWGLSTQAAVSEESIGMADKVTAKVEEARLLYAQGKPITMPPTDWLSFAETMDVAEQLANRHRMAWAQLNAVAAEIAETGDTPAIVAGEVIVIESAETDDFVTNLLIFGGVAALAGGAYWLYRRNKKG